MNKTIAFYLGVRPQTPIVYGSLRLFYNKHVSIKDLNITSDLSTVFPMSNRWHKHQKKKSCVTGKD